MPGVPSSRGCDACRQQKKKCDQANPACARCARLGIECHGAGTQRFKFQVYTAQRRSPKGHSQRPGSRSSIDSQLVTPAPAPVSGLGRHLGRQAALPRQGLILLSTPAGNAQTAITGRLLSALQVTDPRFDLSVYGSFLRDIPPRVGHSPVLDSAVSALTVAFPLAMSVPGSDGALSPVARPTVEMLQQYGHALAMLRSSLSSRHSIASPDTLCALYLLVILHGWLQQDDGHMPGHGEAISLILSAMAEYQTSWGKFEHGIARTLSFLVAMESLINPRLKLNGRIRQLVNDELPATSCLDSSVLLDISTYLRQPNIHAHSLADAYDRVRADRARFATLIASIPVIPTDSGRILRPPSTELCSAHLRLQTGYATLTLIAIRIAAVLYRGRHPCTEINIARPELEEDFRIYVNDLATVAEQAIQYYPLGSSFMPLCLLAAYATLSCMGNDQLQKVRILRLFSRYRPGVNFEQEWSKIEQAKNDLDARRMAQQDGTPAEAGVGENVDALLTKDDMCCIL